MPEYAGDAVGRFRVGREPVGCAAPIGRVGNAAEGRQHVRDAARMPAGGRGVLRAKPVRLPLVVPAELQEQHAQTLRRGAGHVGLAVAGAHRRNEDLSQNQAHLRTGGPAVGLHGVTRGHVADLVTDHAGQLRLVVEVRHQPARQVDEASPAGRTH